jgi:hypothetical protein
MVLDPKDLAALEAASMRPFADPILDPANPNTIDLMMQIQPVLDYALDPPADNDMLADNVRLVRNGAGGRTARVALGVRPSFQGNGWARNVKIHLRLGYVSYDEEGVERHLEECSAYAPYIGKGVSVKVERPDDGLWSVLPDENPNIPPYAPEEGGGDGFIRGSEAILTYDYLYSGDAPTQMLTYKLYGDLPEGTKFFLYAWAEYEEFIEQTGSASAGVNDPANVHGPGWPGDKGAPNREAVFYLIASNMLWNQTVYPVAPEVVWGDRYNYMVMDVKVQNVSQTTQSLINHVQQFIDVSSNMSPNAHGGVNDRDIRRWLYNDGNGPIEFDDPEEIGYMNNEYYIGIRGKGGVLIYDITDKKPDGIVEAADDIVWERDLKGAEMPYIVSGEGVFGFDDLTELYPVSVADEETRLSYRIFRLYVPVVNQFKNLSGQPPGPPFPIKPAVHSTIFFGDPRDEVQWTKDKGLVFLFVPRTGTMSLSKVAAEPDKTGYYYNDVTFRIQDIVNGTNYTPALARITDQMPAGFDLHTIRYMTPYNPDEPADPKNTRYDPRAWLGAAGGPDAYEFYRYDPDAPDLREHDPEDDAPVIHQDVYPPLEYTVAVDEDGADIWEPISLGDSYSGGPTIEKRSDGTWWRVWTVPMPADWTAAYAAAHKEAEGADLDGDGYGDGYIPGDETMTKPVAPYSFSPKIRINFKD